MAAVLRTPLQELRVVRHHLLGLYPAAFYQRTESEEEKVQAGADRSKLLQSPEINFHRNTFRYSMFQFSFIPVVAVNHVFIFKSVSCESAHVPDRAAIRFLPTSISYNHTMYIPKLLPMLPLVLPPSVAPVTVLAFSPQSTTKNGGPGGFAAGFGTAGSEAAHPHESARACQRKCGRRLRGCSCPRVRSRVRVGAVITTRVPACVLLLLNQLINTYDNFRSCRSIAHISGEHLLDEFSQLPRPEDVPSVDA